MIDETMIHEVIVTTRHPDGRTHCAPMGISQEDGHFVIAPFRPSTTLDFLLTARAAVLNYTDDVRIFAGCLTGRRDWPLAPAHRVAVPRLAAVLAHTEVELVRVVEDEVRPRLLCRRVWDQTHAPFKGFNRAQAAVIELAILVSRLDRLPADKIAREIEYLHIALEKTAGPHEREAWGWLMARVHNHQATLSARGADP
jgi:uncharacterized protein